MAGIFCLAHVEIAVQTLREMIRLRENDKIQITTRGKNLFSLLNLLVSEEKNFDDEMNYGLLWSEVKRRRDISK